MGQIQKPPDQTLGTICASIQISQVDYICSNLDYWSRLQHPAFLCPKDYTVETGYGLCCQSPAWLQVRYQLPHDSLKSRSDLSEDQACLVLNSCLIALSFLQQNKQHHGFVRPEFIFMQPFGGAKLLSPALCLTDDNYSAASKGQLLLDLLPAQVLKIKTKSFSQAELIQHDIYALAVSLILSCTSRPQLNLRDKLKTMQFSHLRLAKLLQKMIDFDCTVSELLSQTSRYLIKSELSLDVSLQGELLLQEEGQLTNNTSQEESGKRHQRIQIYSKLSDRGYC